jgi:ferredoxin
MKIAVDYDLCSSNGECALAAPNVFRLENENLFFEPSPDESERAAVADAVLACPMQAITLSE